MDTMPLLYLVAALLSTLVLFLLSGHRHHSRNLPLPPTISGAVPVLGHLHLLMGPRRRKEPLHRTLTALSAAHGPVLLLRFGSRPVLSISSPSSAEDCLTINDITFSNRPPQLSTKYLGFDGSTIATASYGPLWRMLRRIATVEIFSTARIQSLANIRAEEIHSLLRSLSSAAAINTAEWTPAEMKTKFKTLTFNTMMRILVGRKYYGEEKTVNSEVGERFRGMIEEQLLLSGASSVEDFLPWMGWLGMGGTKKRMMRLAKEMDEILKEMVDERRRRRRRAVKAEAAGTEKTIVDVMLALQEQEPDKYSDFIIKGMISNIMVAGTDTSAITMEWALSLLLNHPKALKKARDEIDSHIGGGGGGHVGRLITDSDLPHLRHLQNIIKETLRLFPAGPLLLPHQSSADCTVAGYTIPSGTMLLINAYAIQRDHTLWKDADSFRPERFDEGEGFYFLPFGSGRRRCPGEGLAYRLMGLAVGALIQCFEWKRVNGEETVDLTEGEGIALPKLVPLEALYKPREVMLPLLSQL